MTRTPLIVGLIVLLVLIGARIWDPVPVQQLRLSYFDTLQRVAPRAYDRTEVRVVDIDAESILALGEWPWPRDILADLVAGLQRYGVSVIAFDVLLSEPDRYSPATLIDREALGQINLPDGVRSRLQSIDFDAELAATFVDVPIVLGVARRSGAATNQPVSTARIIETRPGLLQKLPDIGAATAQVPILREQAAGIGVVNIDSFSGASVVRSVPLMWKSQEMGVPSLALEAVRIAQGAPSMSVHESHETAGEVGAIWIDSTTAKTRGDGQMWMRFREDHPDLYVSAKDVMRGGSVDPVLRAQLEGHIVFVGTTAAGRFDTRTTALGETLPSVSIHAQAAEQILLGQFLTRPGWSTSAELAGLVLLSLLVGYRMLRSGPAFSFATGFAGAAMLVIASWLAFRYYNILIDASFPLIGGFLAFAVVTGYQFIAADRDKREMRRTLSRYVAPTVLQQIEGRGYALDLGGEMREATVMFSDIRGFTSISEQYSAEELVRFLNELFGCLSTEILRTQGTIDKFIGDSVMAFWNAPLPVDDYPERAMEAALGMRAALKTYNLAREDAPVRLAMGLSTGEVCVGNIGSADRFDYSVIGDNVNVAARLEAACRVVGCDVLVSDPTYREAERFACLYAGALTLKGVSAATHAWVLCGDGKLAGSYVFKSLTKAHRAWQRAVRREASEAELRDLLVRCRDAAKAVSPELTDFIDNLDARRADYLDPPDIDKTVFGVALPSTDAGGIVDEIAPAS